VKSRGSREGGICLAATEGARDYVPARVLSALFIIDSIRQGGFFQTARPGWGPSENYLANKPKGRKGKNRTGPLIPGQTRG